jgi:transposase-like protein
MFWRKYMVKCPKCQIDEVKEEVHYAGLIFSRRKIITNYCPVCDWEHIKKIKINEEEYQSKL